MRDMRYFSLDDEGGGSRDGRSCGREGRRA